MEVVEGVLILIMELADRNLQSVLFDYQNQGQPGVPRKQLLGFLLEAAEALDVINFQFGLQHLDVKPHNLFVVSNHVKVADFGLVHRLPRRRRRIASARRGGAASEELPLQHRRKLFRRFPQPAQRPVQSGDRLPATADRHRAVLVGQPVSRKHC